MTQYIHSYLFNRKHNDAKSSSESPVSSSLAECDLLTCTEADQSQLQTQTPMMGAEKASKTSTKQVLRILLIIFYKNSIKDMYLVIVFPLILDLRSIHGFS